jgi:leucyl aminopeptidase
MSFAAVARDVALAAGAEAHVWSTDELREGRFAGLLEVGKAGDEPPALVELVHRGADPGAPTVALVGKGITFDSGGYDIKPIGEMARMKCDMAGAAAVLGAIEVAARLALPINILGLLAIAENVLGGNALRPGDVIVHRNGITSEVTNPDAEGRLVLADALAYAAEQRPAAIVEVSTLVGPPLGSDLWGLVASDDALAERLLEAGRAVSDPGWRLPLWRRYRRHISSPIADQRNSTQSLDYPIAVISSALFLDRFVPREIPWAHIDIGATAAREGGTASPAWPVGATGSPMRALVAWLAGRYDPTGVG